VSCRVLPKFLVHLIALVLLSLQFENVNADDTVVHHHILRQIVEFGTAQDTHNTLSPPWRNELATSEIDAVTAFVAVLQSDFKRASQLLASVNIPPERIDGRKIYRARCESCHGVTGEGNGRMSRVIRNPPPANLTRSVLSAEEMMTIISAGGEAVGRSNRMPPWGQELAHSELLSIINYLASMRTADNE